MSLENISTVIIQKGSILLIGVISGLMIFNINKQIKINSKTDKNIQCEIEKENKIEKDKETEAEVLSENETQFEFDEGLVLDIPKEKYKRHYFKRIFDNIM